MATPLKVLLLEDNEDDAALLLRALREAGYEPEARRVWEAADFDAALAMSPDVVFVDYRLPGWSGEAALARLRSLEVDAPAIVVSGAIGDEAATATMRLGAVDYVLKDRLARLGAAVARALEERRLRRAEEAAAANLRESERFNRATLDALGAQVAVLDAEGTILATNTAWREFARENGGDPRETGEGVNYLGVCERAAAAGDRDAAEVVAGIRRVIAGASPAWFMEHGCFSSKERRWFFCAVRRFPGDGPVRVVVAHENVTPLRLAQEALRESEERHRLLFEGNPLPMWLFDQETLRFLAVNESAVRQYGFSHEEFLSMRITDIHPPEDVPAMLKWLEKNREKARSMAERRHRKKGGEVIEVETISRPLHFQGRQVRLVVANDVTERKRLEEKVLHAQRLESLGMLAAGIAHDLNNVLAPIMFAAPILRDSLRAPRDLKILDTLERSAERGAGLVRQILGFARASAGNFATMALKHVVRDVLGVIEETFPKSIRLEHRMPADLWPVYGNATQIHQVLLNLCLNARDAMAAGGVLLLAAENRRLEKQDVADPENGRAGDWVVLEVSDTGTGIAPEILERIWEPFFTMKGPGKGTGLGLSTVRGIVASHQGFTEVDTELGRGTTFRIFLPAAEHEPPRMEGKRAGAGAAELRGRGELVLVADDDGFIREIVAEILGTHGYRVATCRDGLEALEFFRGHAPEVALIVTDVDMPRLDGTALVRAARQLRQDIRVIAMSGLSHREPEPGGGRPIQELTQAYLLKPFAGDELLAAVHAQTGGAGSEERGVRKR